MSGTRTKASRSILLAFGLAAGCTCTSVPTIPADGGGLGVDSGAQVACSPGRPACEGDTHFVCGADGMSHESEMQCPEECHAALGCITCRPGSRRCSENVSQVCLADASGWIDGRDCSEWEAYCDADGYCRDDCGDAERSHAYVGCEYWATPFANAFADNRDIPIYEIFDFRVAISNPNDRSVRARITRGATLFAETTVPAHDAVTIPLAWIPEHYLTINAPNGWSGLAVADAAYRVTTDLPVSVAQFNPFEYSVDWVRPTSITNVQSLSNDASLLLPAHALTGDYFATTYYPTRKYPDMIGIIGTSPGVTTVEVELRGRLEEDRFTRRWTSGFPGTTVTFTVSQGEVLHLPSPMPPSCTSDHPNFAPTVVGDPGSDGICREAEYDLTGSRIRADRPLAVFGLHFGAFVPFDTYAADYLEEQLPPLETWGRDFVAAPMWEVTPRDNFYRFLGSVDGTVVTLDPPQAGMSELTVDEGTYVELLSSEPFRATSTHPILLSQFLVGQQHPPVSRSDPSLTIVVPREQWRRDYIFAAPSSYRASADPLRSGQAYVLIVRRAGTEVLHNGEPVDAPWEMLGDQEIGTIPIEGGAHRLTSVEPFAALVFGLGSNTTFAYPAGLDLVPGPI